MRSLWLSLPLAWAVGVAATCYYPDGSVAGTYSWVPCKGTGTASACCIPNEGDVCMADGLCNWVGHYYFRGACTDKTWQDPNCAQVCKGDNPSGYVAAQQCPSGDYCCGSGCCTDGTSGFALNNTATLAFASTSTTATSTTSKKTTTTRPRTTSTSSRTTSASGTLPSSSGVTATAASATSTPGSASNGGGGGSKNKDLGVALGVGLAGSIIGVACAVAVVMLIRRDKKRKREAAEAALLAPSALPPMSTTAEGGPLASPAPTFSSPYPSPYPTPSPGASLGHGGRL
ncbi:hypothetical protein NKR19_g4189 [Coniochaeta hoffmannii]|uniref:Mid2 domain-containing protein n=1 Tax=Coniochaeta hoffmannii TaxID=91930 RepID=A0AA38W010_9PEZI|nr:hypothetical protein NKR19_g4189 [Coniochaeta hoffmannii]